MRALEFKDVCTFYPVAGLTSDGRASLGDGVPVPCMFEQTTAYQHTNSQDAIVGVPRLILPADDPFVLARAYRLEELVVEVNLWGGTAGMQRFKVDSVTPGRDLLLGNEVTHVECDLVKVEV